jgi:hypothetical protein
MLSKLRREIADFIAAFADHTFQFSMQFSVSLEVAKEQPLKVDEGEIYFVGPCYTIKTPY